LADDSTVKDEQDRYVCYFRREVIEFVNEEEEEKRG
jgi:hypothetical protein